MTSKPDLEDYKTVPERISEFRAKYPDGCLRPVNPEKPYAVHEIGQHTFIVYVAAAYRDAKDELPGIGAAWEPFPGTTPYTRNSELMNAETSAWGRAIVAVLAADTQRSVASREEVRNRTEAAAPARPRASQVTPAQQRAARTPDPDRGKTPTEQREARARRTAEEKAVAQARAQDRPMDRGPLPDADNAWQDTAPENLPGSITPGQHRSLEALLGQFYGLDSKDRDGRHLAVQQLLSLPEAPASLTGTQGLSYTQAKTARDKIVAMMAEQEREAKLAAASVPDHAQRAANDYPPDWPT